MEFATTIEADCYNCFGTSIEKSKSKRGKGRSTWMCWRFVALWLWTERGFKNSDELLADANPVPVLISTLWTKDAAPLEELGNSWKFSRLLQCCWWTKFGHQLSLVVHRFQLVCQILSISLPDVSWFGRITLKAWCVFQRSFGGLLFKSCGRQKFGWFGSIHIEGGHGCFLVNRNLKEDCFPFWSVFCFLNVLI